MDNTLKVSRQIETTKITVSISKKIQETQFEPYEVTIGVEKPVRTTDNKKIVDELNKLFVDVENVVVDAVNAHLEKE